MDGDNGVHDHYLAEVARLLICHVVVFMDRLGVVTWHQHVGIIIASHEVRVGG